jgi:hypothetical protein
MDVVVETAKTFVGTSQYVSPELLEANETSRRSVTAHISVLLIMTDFDPALIFGRSDVSSTK